MSTTILSTRYNNLKNRIRAIMGVSGSASPTTGYGQATSSGNVVGSRSVNDLDAASKITAEQYRDLYLDIVRARVHQIGSSFSIDPFVVGNYLLNTTSTDKVEETYISNLESIVTQIELDKFNVDLNTQISLENLTNAVGIPISSTRLQSTYGAWNGTKTHILTVDFASALDRRHFFNAGGQIRFNANINYTFSQTKTVTWRNSLSTMGNVAFTANETKSINTGQTRAIGNYSLNGTYQLAFRHAIGGVYSGAYYELYALQNSDTQIQFRIYFRDATVEGTDEDVFGDLTSRVQIARPDGEVTIDGQTLTTVLVNAPLVGTELTSINNP